MPMQQWKIDLQFQYYDGDQETIDLIHKMVVSTANKLQATLRLMPSSKGEPYVSVEHGSHFVPFKQVDISGDPTFLASELALLGITLPKPPVDGVEPVDDVYAEMARMAKEG